MGEQRFGRGFFNWIARQLGRPGTAKAFPDTAGLSRRRQWILTDLDLEPIFIKAMDAEEGHGWTFDFACRVAQEYRRFLVLCLEHPSEPVVPSSLVDDFWHLHILDTQKYIGHLEKSDDLPPEILSHHEKVSSEAGLHGPASSFG